MQKNCSLCLWCNNIYNFTSYQAIKYVLRLQTKEIVGKGGKMALLVKKVADPCPNPNPNKLKTKTENIL